MSPEPSFGGYGLCLQHSWRVTGDARLERVENRFARGRHVAAALLATGAIHVGLIAFLMRKLF